MATEEAKRILAGVLILIALFSIAMLVPEWNKLIVSVFESHLASIIVGIILALGIGITFFLFKKFGKYW